LGGITKIVWLPYLFGGANKEEAIMQISQFTYKDCPIELTVNNGFIAYTFTYNGKSYGVKNKIESKKVLNIASVAFNLALNAIETYEDLRLREGTTEARPEVVDSGKPE
jgi:hypothetical protein